MRINLPGYWSETLPSGSVRHLVRVKGQKRKKITLSVGPDHKLFTEHYHAARQGIRLEAPTTAIEAAVPRSVAWLTHRFEAFMQDRVEAGLMDPRTLHQRAAFYVRLREKYGQKQMAMPQSAVIEIRDSMSKTPGAADNMVKAIRALYAWAMDQPDCVTANPAAGVGKINQGRGATPWTVADLRQYRERHPFGTMAHLALTLFMFTACRIEDSINLGRPLERRINSVRSLDWQPGKKGSARVVIPMLPPLARAIDAQTVVGSTYLLRADGKPFSSPNSFDNWFRKRIIEAGLTKNVGEEIKAARSSHGIRKAAGELLAIEGATQYHIMAVHGHTQAKTSEIYTAGANRIRLGAEAMKYLAKMDW